MSLKYCEHTFSLCLRPASRSQEVVLWNKHKLSRQTWSTLIFHNVAGGQFFPCNVPLNSKDPQHFMWLKLKVRRCLAFLTWNLFAKIPKQFSQFQVIVPFEEPVLVGCWSLSLLSWGVGQIHPAWPVQRDSSWPSQLVFRLWDEVRTESDDLSGDPGVPLTVYQALKTPATSPDAQEYT